MQICNALGIHSCKPRTTVFAMPIWTGCWNRQRNTAAKALAQSYRQTSLRAQQNGAAPSTSPSHQPGCNLCQADATARRKGLVNRFVLREKVSAGTVRQVSSCFAINLNNGGGEAHFASPSHWPAQRDEADVTAMRNGRTILPSPNKRLAPGSPKRLLDAKMCENSRKNPPPQRALPCQLTLTRDQTTRLPWKSRGDVLSGFGLIEFLVQPRPLRRRRQLRHQNRLHWSQFCL